MYSNEHVQKVMSTLVTGGEVAQMFGVSASAVSNWLNRHDDFPKPVYEFNERLKLYRRCDVLEWYTKRVGREEIQRQFEHARGIVDTLGDYLKEHE